LSIAVSSVGPTCRLAAEISARDDRVYRLGGTLPGDQAFRPLDTGDVRLGRRNDFNGSSAR
jgi:hypothetical protein